jgi:hypothetical protein
LVRAIDSRDGGSGLPDDLVFGPGDIALNATEPILGLSARPASRDDGYQVSQ